MTHLDADALEALADWYDSLDACRRSAAPELQIKHEADTRKLATLAGVVSQRRRRLFTDLALSDSEYPQEAA